jgi:hypothetical protein
LLSRLGLLVACVILSTAPHRVCAQTVARQAADANATAPLSAEESAAIAQRLMQGPPPPQRCGVPASDGTIIVCGGKAASDKERLPLREELESARSTKDGLPRAPNVSGMRDCSRGCIGLGSAPVAMYYFDLKALPEAPPDSDAAKIARGEIRAP